MNKLRPGAVISARELITIGSMRIRLPDPTGVVHLQFRRYAGCPFCDLHLRSIVRRHQELVATGIREVVVFQSSSAELLAQQGDVPFAVIADPSNRGRRRPRRAGRNHRLPCPALIWPPRQPPEQNVQKEATCKTGSHGAAKANARALVH
jgi:hypothetical protein